MQNKKGILFWDWLGTIYDPLEKKIIPCAQYLLDNNFEYYNVLCTNGYLKDLKTAEINFDLICSRDNFLPKPNPEMFIFALKKFNCSVTNCSFVGDSDSDEIVAAKLSLKFFKVDGTYSSYYEIAKFLTLV